MRRPQRRESLLLAVALLPAWSGPIAAQDPDATVRPVRLPDLWGQHAVGVRTLVFEDSTRSARSDGGHTIARPILVRAWYPAGPVPDGSARAYMHPSVAQAWRSTLPVPAGWESGVVTNAVADAPLADDRDRWPVLLFSHGRSFPVENYQILLEQLASQGWVIAAISHVGEEALTRLPDGTSFGFRGPGWEDDEERGEVLMSVVADLVHDGRRVLDALERLDASDVDPWGGRLRLEAGVGYFGHSLGGAAAAWTLQRDPRITAAVSWEGQVYRERDRPLTVAGPLLYIIGGANREEFAGRHFRGGGPDRPAYEAILHGAWHASVGDLLYIYSRYAPRDWHERHRREITAERANQITADLIHAFFGRHLLEIATDLLEPDAPGEEVSHWTYPEVELRLNAGGGGFWKATPAGR